MPKSEHLPGDHPPVRHGRIGLLLVNLGTPEAASTKAVRRYLREFLSDRRVIETNPLLWQPLLNLVILPFRAARSAKAYAAIWDNERNESPLRRITRTQCEALAESLSGNTDERLVDWAMRYGEPSIAQKLQAMAEAGCERIAVFALYPQYSATTTASVYDEAFRSLMRMRWQPAIRTLPAYHDHRGYIDALARSVLRQIDEQGWEPEVVLASFHGLPQRYFEAGDPYHCHCRKTGRLLREALGRDERSLRITFQSRFGPEDWLRPYTDKTLEALPGEGVEAVTVVTPGFAADCLETLEEIGIAGREQFLDAGGKRYSVVPCLNDSADHIAALRDIVEQALSGWIRS